MDRNATMGMTAVAPSQTSAKLLGQISEALGVAPETFLHPYETRETGTGPEGDLALWHRLGNAFRALPDGTVRLQVVEVVEALATRPDGVPF